MALVSDFVEMCICQGAREKRGMTNSFGSHEGSGGGARRERGVEAVLMKRRRVVKGMEKWRWG